MDPEQAHAAAAVEMPRRFPTPFSLITSIALVAAAVVLIRAGGSTGVVAVAAVAGVCGVALVMRLSLQRASGRIIKGACPVCGYDLRGTPYRCPECGKRTSEGEFQQWLKDEFQFAVPGDRESKQQDDRPAGTPGTKGDRR